MPRLLDKRVVGYDLADVNTKSYSGVQPGWTLQVAQDGNSLVLGPSASSSIISKFSQFAKDATDEQEGLSLQQYLAQNWLDITTDITGTAFAAINSIAYGKGVFVAVGYDASGNPLVKYSSVVTPYSTTVGWSDIPNNVFSTTSNPLPLFGVRFFNNQFIAFGAGGTIGTSIDGINWSLQPRTLAGDFYSMAYGPSIGYVVVGTVGGHLGAGVAYFSTDAANWSPIANPLGTGPIWNYTTGVWARGDSPLYGVNYGNDNFVAVGGLQYGLIAVTGGPPLTTGYSNVPHIAVSTDGKLWRTTQSALPLHAHYTCEYANGIWVVGSNTQTTNTTDPNYGKVLQYSIDDAITWKTSTVNVKSGDTVATSANLQGFAYGNGIFVGVNDFPNISADGVNWYRTYPPATWPGTGTGVSSGTTGAYGNGVFVIGNRYGRMIRSSLVGETFGGGTSSGGGGTGSSGSLPVNIQTFTSSGTWTKPSAGTIVVVELWGSGGGGGDLAGGGGGGYTSITCLLSDFAGNVPVIIGAGGAPLAGGSNTIFGSLSSPYLVQSGGGPAILVSGCFTNCNTGITGNQGQLIAAHNITLISGSTTGVPFGGAPGAYGGTVNTSVFGGNGGASGGNGTAPGGGGASQLGGNPGSGASGQIRVTVY